MEIGAEEMISDGINLSVGFSETMMVWRVDPMELLQVGMRMVEICSVLEEVEEA